MRKLRLLFATLALLVTGVVAVNAQVMLETDLTSQFSSLTIKDNWTFPQSSGWPGYTDPGYCPKVTVNGLDEPKQVIEHYVGTCTQTGDIFFTTVTGLAPGTYKIELYGGAAFTFGRGFGSTAFTGSLDVATNSSYSAGSKIEPSEVVNTGVKLYAIAEEVEYGGEIPIYYATNFPEGASVITLSGVVVNGSGQIKIGMSKTSTSTNWHVIQLKGVTATVDVQALYNNSLSKAQTAAGNKMSSSALSALTTAISTYGSLSSPTAQDYKDAADALDEATAAAQVSINAYAIFNSVIDVFADAKQALDADGLAAYDDGGVLAGLQESYNAGTLQEITSDQKATIANALAVAAKAQTSENSPMTWAILNHSFETGSLQAWTAENTAGDTGVKPNSNGTYTTIGCDGDFLFNTWNGDAVGYGISQTVTDMPAGSYKLTASFAGPANATVELFANSESTTVTQTAPGTFTDVDLEFDLATAGDITIGTQNSTSWYKVDNFRLILLQPAVVPDYTISLNVTGTNDMADSPTITVAGATQSGDVAYTAAANSTISITPEAVDGYSVEVTVTQTPATGGPEETVSASEVSGTWSFTLPENNVRVSIAYTPIPTYSINGLAYGSQVTIGEVSTTIGDVSTITGVNAGELVTIDVSGVTVSPGMVTMIHANTGAGALTEEALSHVGDVWTFTMPEGDAHLTFAEEYVYSTFTLNVTEGEGMTEAPNVSYSPQFTNAGKVRSGSNVTINIPAYAGYDATATYQAASDAEPTTLTISNNQAQLTMPAEDVTATVVYTKHAYAISGLPATNTTLTIGETQYESGDVTATIGTVITVTPDLGYQITAITATYTPATGGDPIELTIDDAAGNGKSFTMPAANVTVTCTAEEIVIDPNAIPVTVPAMSFVTYVDDNQDLSLATGDQAQLYGVSDVTDTEVQLTDQLTSVPSGHHFLIYNPTDADIIAQLMPSAPTGGLEGVGNWFFLDINDGTINPDDYTGFTLYICGGKQFLKAIGAGQLADHRWMLMVANETEGGYGEKARNIVFGETTNKITATNINNATKGDFFDLNGRKLDKMPTKKGVYIQNGKKVVVK